MKRKLRLPLILLSVLCLLLWAVPALAMDYEDMPGQELRVLLQGSSSATSFSITVDSGNYSITADGKTYAKASAGDMVSFTRSGSSYSFSCGENSGSSSTAFLAVPATTEDSFTFNGTSYRGCFRAIYSGSYYYAVNQINSELYSYGVVGRELGYSYNMEATKAQAVVSRSYAISNYSSSNKYYDLTATSSSQVYGGKAAETARIRQTVDETRGYVLKYNDKVITSYFGSNAGGYTENIENVWVSDAVPIKGVASPHDAKAGNYGSYGASSYSWTVEYTPEELVSMANRYGKTDIGTYQSIEYSDTLNGVTSVSGRAMTLTIHGSKGSVTATKDNIRSLLNLKSTLIDIVDGGNSKVSAYVMGEDNQVIGLSSLDEVYAISAGSAVAKVNSGAESIFAKSVLDLLELSKKPGLSSTVTIRGKGYGHGVGMSQFGAIAMGDDGYTWQEIVEHYFCEDTGILLVRSY